MNTLSLARARRTAAVRLTGLAAAAILLSACDDGPSSPTAPTPTAAAPPSAVTFTLSGAVSEMTTDGPTPISGARVVETSSGQAAVTDANGFYRIQGLSAASHSFSITREGYVSGAMTVMISGDTQLDVQLERMATYTLSGVVFEMTDGGPAPVEGVELYCDSCGSPQGHTFVHTDAEGAYSFGWAANGQHPLYVTKAGYDIFDPSGTLRDRFGRITATVQGDTRFDVQLVQR